ncbi:Nn.00g099310.m01.CDS01 [Neocucurbitaria sp. VM-36]
MTSQLLEAALGEPDTDASHLRLNEIIAARSFGGRKLPSIAESYLQAFTDITSSSTRRRWVGLALAGMIDMSLDVVHHLKQFPQELQGLGTIILSNTEREETKIVTGIIMRQCLERGIDYCNFWASDKVQNSAPNFPGNSGPRWMAEFQSFLDTLGDLALSDPATDPSIIYPISLVASDGFRWRDSDDGLPIALIQAGMLTVIAPDGLLREIQFIDIPIGHVKSIRCRRSILHDSQAQTIGHEPWDLILELRADPWSYRLNTSRRTGSEITLLFHHSADAKEWEKCIKDQRNGLGSSATSLHPVVHPLMSSSSPIDLRHSPPMADSVVHLKRPNGITQSHSSLKSSCSQPLVTRSSDLAHANRPQMLPQSPQIDRRQERPETSSDQLGESLPPPSVGPKKAPMKTKQMRERRENDIAKSVQKSNASSSDNISGGAILVEQTEPMHTTSGRVMRNEGKLPSVSQAAKLKASKQLHPQLDVFELPEENPKWTKVGKKAGREYASSSGPTSQKHSQKSKAVIHKSTSNVKGQQSQAKRKADDDDDDFVPEKERRRAKTNTRRKSASANNADKMSRKDARTETSEDTRLSTEKNKRKNARTALRQLAPAESKVTMVSKSRAHKPKSVDKTPSSVTSSRYSLIGGLLNSQKSLKGSPVTFRKPELPNRASEATKAKVQLMMPQGRPQTPTSARRRINDEPLSLPLVSSSPPLGNTTGRRNMVQQAAANAEILSSNSKPLPASPNAESTAISGHADRDEVDLEKIQSDLQMATSDPFRRRREGQTATSFTRRLTGEGLATGNSYPQESPSHRMSYDLANFDSSDIDDVLITGASQPFSRVPGAIQVFEAQAPQSPEPVSITKTNSKSSLGQSAQHATGRTSMEAAPSAVARLPDKEVKVVEMENSILTAPQQAIDNTQIDPPTQAYDDVEMDGNTTLVNQDEGQQTTMSLKASPICFYSSPPVPGSPSSHSSTSAEPEPTSQPPISTPEAEEMDWEASLQPHQRAIHDLLIRTSKRVLRHIVDSETAVTDIAEIFARDGSHVLDTLRQRHHSDYDRIFQDMENKMKSLRRELERAAKDLSKERRRVSAVG